MTTGAPQAPRRQRVDAKRNVDALLEASREVFDTSGVDAPAKEIADRAGVGVGTLYRHFPRRADLVAAVIQSGIDALAESGPTLSAERDAGPALREWLHRYTDLLSTKRGLAGALHSGDPAYDGLPAYFFERLEPTARTLLGLAATAGAVRKDVEAKDLLLAIAHLCMPMADQGPEHAHRMVAVFIDGMRHPGPERTVFEPGG